MTALSAEKLTVKLPGPVENDFIGTDYAGLPMAASVKIYAGGLVGLNSAGTIQPMALNLGGLTCLGVADVTKDNTSGGASALKCPVRAGNGAWGPFVNSGSTITAAHVGRICYALDDQTVALTDGAGARSPAGTIAAVDSTGVYLKFGASASSSEPMELASSQYGRRVARCCIHTNLASLASFTVASRDGLTLVAGDRVLLINQTTAAQNGLYEVGTVASGSAPLTLATDWATGLVVGGQTVAITAGTLFGGMDIKVTNTTLPTIGTTTVTFAPVRQVGTATLVDGDKTVDTTVWLTSASKIILSRGPVSGVPGPCLVHGTISAGLPGAGSFPIKAGTLADPVVATSTDDGDINYEILG